jgi:hypothetical protein
VLKLVMACFSCGEAVSAPVRRRVGIRTLDIRVASNR